MKEESLPMMVVDSNGTVAGEDVSTTPTREDDKGPQVNEIIDIDVAELVSKVRQLSTTILSTTTSSRIRSLTSSNINEQRRRSVDIMSPTDQFASDQSKLLASMAQIRELFRMGNLSLNARKQAIADAKARGDSQRLLLNNIKYEILQVQKEIIKCQQFE